MKDDLYGKDLQVRATAERLLYQISKHDGWDAIAKDVDEALQRAETTLSEAKIMHNIMRDNRTALSQRQLNVEQEMNKHREKTGLIKINIHPTLRARANEFARV